jgi:hypothetical protein
MANVERIRLWQAALRSKKFQQAVGGLRLADISAPGGYGYCCLGVATIVALESGTLEFTEEEERLIADNEFFGATHDVWDLADGYLSAPVIRWYGFDVADPEVGYGPECIDHCDNCKGKTAPVEGARANDDLGWTFDQIANGLDEVYPEVPVESGTPV